MVKCYDCKKEMTSKNTNSCDLKYKKIKINGKVYDRVTNVFDYGDTCHDCNIKNKTGNLHHFGCDVERCPKCGGKLISCSCGHKTLVKK
jgi:rRNA maturation endonuclease Nob1